MRLALTAGGTGGHIIPALAVLDALRRRDGLELDVRFFGPEDRGERALVEARGLTFETVPAAGVRGRGPLRAIRSLARLAWGVAVATRRLRRYRPSAVFSTGGYASFPCSLAARLLRRPLVVFLPDVAPGWAVRAEKRLASRVATTTEAALEHLPRSKTAVTGYPVRAEFFSVDREAARKQLGLGLNDRLLLVAGASQGSTAINAAVLSSLETLLGSAMVVHVTGPEGLEAAEQARAGLAPAIAARYLPAAFRDDLPVVMLAADLAVMRAGASTLGELPAAALPSILVPGTFAGGHQRDNAAWLAAGGAAMVLEESALEELPRAIHSLLVDRDLLSAMRKAAARLARPDAADAIGGLILQVARR